MRSSCFLGLEGDTPSEVVIAILLIPLLWNLVSLAMYFWSCTAASVQTVRERVALAQRVDDMTRIDGNVGVIKLGKHAFELRDNDAQVIDGALGTFSSRF